MTTGNVKKFACFLGFKERWFKLRLNILFYFNLSESGTILDLKPSGAFILEDCTAAQEMLADTPFTFSLKFSDDKDRKHIFAGRTEDSIGHWVQVLNSAGCCKLRRQLTELQNKIAYLTGQTFSEFCIGPSQPLEIPKKSSFKSYIGIEGDVAPIQPSNDFRTFDDFINGLGAIGQASNDREFNFSEEKKDINSMGNAEVLTIVPTLHPHRKAPDPPKRPPRNVKPTLNSSNTENNLIQF